jgi:hypothetical protein
MQDLDDVLGADGRKRKAHVAQWIANLGTEVRVEFACIDGCPKFAGNTKQSLGSRKLRLPGNRTLEER